jgi:hypothetical protein
VTALEGSKKWITYIKISDIHLPTQEVGHWRFEFLEKISLVVIENTDVEKHGQLNPRII